MINHYRDISSLNKRSLIWVYANLCVSCDVNTVQTEEVKETG